MKKAVLVIAAFVLALAAMAGTSGFDAQTARNNAAYLSLEAYDRA